VFDKAISLPEVSNDVRVTDLLQGVDKLIAVSPTKNFAAGEMQQLALGERNIALNGTAVGRLLLDDRECNLVSERAGLVVLAVQSDCYAFVFRPPFDFKNAGAGAGAFGIVAEQNPENPQERAFHIELVDGSRWCVFDARCCRLPHCR
jgi:hypothetical protein